MQGEVAATEQVFSAQRRAMVDGQIRTFDVTDARVVRAFDLTRRELFLPEDLRAFSYSDAILTLKSPGTGRPVRTLMQPMHLARMLQGVDPAPDAHVLVVAGGAGYAAAVLLEMVGSVVTLESDAGLTALAADVLVKGSAGRASAVTGPLAEGWAARAPYDAIVVLGAVESGLDALFAQLKPRGTLAAVATSTENNGRRSGRVTLYTKAGEDVSGRVIFDATVPVLAEFKANAGFVF
jgi:protein-L-isoaspartate(D-aspartate) O-methyltransferase